jgi:hypothetical protein
VAAGIRDAYWGWMGRGEHRQPVAYVET